MDSISGQDGRRLSSVGILVVDADGGYRRLVLAELRNLGARKIVGVGTSDQALQTMLTEAPDIILTEYYLPLVRQIRTHEKTQLRRIPIILVTDQTTREQVIEARDAGINTFVAKPVSSTLLCEQIIRALKDRRPLVAVPGGFSGPDRRRRAADDFQGPDRRKGFSAAQAAR